jgi:hypothetical protein
MRYFIDWLEHALKEIFLHHRHNEFAEELTNPHILHLRLERQHPQREHVVAGRLMSYGISSAGAYREGRRLRWLNSRYWHLTDVRYTRAGFSFGRGTFCGSTWRIEPTENS